ncbi:MAG: ABC transporter ATP-binding protein [Phycisphaerae bacterium]|nr:ABC transporter ATP-binding protein [Phycisphaerae bacterium]
MTSAASIALSGVAITRSRRRILDVDALRIDGGQFINLIGTNGAGKTTLLNVCCGLTRPDCGTVTFDRVDLCTFSGWGKSRLRKRIGYIPQRADYNAELPFTVREVAVMGRTARKPLGVPLGRTDYAVTDHWLDTLGIADRRGQTFRSLSGGEQQKVLIARAMAQEPELLILDEPVASLDLNWKFQIIEIVTQLHAQLRLTVILVSHEIQSLPLAADRTILLHNGRITADGPTRDILTSPELAQVYQTRVRIVETEPQPYVYCQPAAGEGGS